MSERIPLNLTTIGWSLKALFTGYLLAIGVGLLMAGMQILLTHGMADGKLGLSIDDIVYSYYGNRDSSKIETKLNGSMKDKASNQVRTDIIKWVRAGSPEAKWEKEMRPLFVENCVKCHATIPGLPNFTTYEGVKGVARIDEGATIDSLARVSHIHLFGIAFIFFFVGLIFSLAVKVPVWLKVVAIGLPFGFLILDVMSWWLTKFSPNFAWLVLIGGFAYTLSSTAMWVISMYQMWIMPMRGQYSDEHAWRH